MIVQGCRERKGGRVRGRPSARPSPLPTDISWTFPQTFLRNVFLNEEHVRLIEQDISDKQ